MTNNFPGAVPKVSDGEIRGGGGTREEMDDCLRMRPALGTEIIHDFTDSLVVVSKRDAKARTELG